jgi:MFS family permease
MERAMTPASAETDDAIKASRWPRALRTLSKPNYQLFFAGQLISLCGTWMQSVGESWLVYRLTGSAALLGVVGFAAQFPVFLFATVGGTVADRINRHRILLATQSVAMLLAFVLAALTLSGRIQVWEVFVLATLVGLVNAFDIPARQAFVVDLVGRGNIVNAVALNSSMFNGARIIGPAIAGILVASVGEGWCFFLNAVSYFAVIGGLLLMRLERQTRVPLPGSTIANAVAGFGYVARTRPVRALLVLLGMTSLMGMPYAVLMPIFDDRILHGGARGLGLLMGATGIGALAGAASLAARDGLRGLGRWIALSTGSFGLFLILFSLSKSFWLSAALLIPVGCSMMVSMAASNTLVQSMVPDELRGRVMAVYSMMFMGMAPIGALLAGALAERFGAPLTVALGGGVCIVGAAIFAWKLPTLRQEARQIIVALEMAAGQPAEQQTGDAAVVAPHS